MNINQGDKTPLSERLKYVGIALIYFALLGMFLCFLFITISFGLKLIPILIS